MQLGSQEWKTFLIRNALNSGIRINPLEADMMAIHAVELMRWNRKTNLTAIKDSRDIAIKHFIDSVTLVPQIPENASVLDIGTGGGFPGIPIKIMRSDVSVTLADSSHKKISFIKNLIRRLQLRSIEAHHCRIELFRQEIHFQKPFDVITCRAFSSLKNFIRVALPLLSEQGMIIALKGDAVRAEIEALREHAFFQQHNLTIRLEKYALPDIDAKRYMVNIYQQKNDPNSIKHIQD
ncbi:16S rRNA (guanine(527)-N(7))-methyltransferase RsmG [Desulfococcaceae bacterium HSG9]|nr:16S rRNA (guanine(527)-N(7))-methyltransferase RsmG [Desulfococcaceae bacterium HSG9]